MTRTAWPLLFVRLGAALLGFALLISLWASPDRLAGLPFTLLALAGVGIVLAATWKKTARRRSGVRPGQVAIVFIVMSAAALVGTLLTSNWPAYKWSWLNAIYGALPSIRSLPFWWAQAGFSPNQTGGFLAVCAAMMATLALMPWTARGLRRPWRWIAAGLAVLGFAVVFMTGSRAALAGLTVSVLLLLILRTRRWLWAWGVAVVMGLIGLYGSGRLTTIFDFFLRDETLDTKVVARLDIWTSALHGIEDHLFTGIGLSVFNDVMPLRYPYRTVGLSYPVSQAHNLFLDVGLSLGIVGLLGLGMLLLGSVLLALRGARSRDISAAVSLGILLSILTFLIFGITDSISFAMPTSFIIWMWATALIVLHDGKSREPVDDLSTSTTSGTSTVVDSV